MPSNWLCGAGEPCANWKFPKLAAGCRVRNCVIVCVCGHPEKCTWPCECETIGADLPAAVDDTAAEVKVVTKDASTGTQKCTVCPMPKSTLSAVSKSHTGSEILRHENIDERGTAHGHAIEYVLSP
jgi:hypothetical protein